MSFQAPRGKFDVEFRQSSLSFIDKNGAVAASCPIANIAVGLARPCRLPSAAASARC